MLAHLQISGSHHAIGVALGRFGAQAMHDFAKQSPAWVQVMRFKDSAAVSAMATIVASEHPAYWAEIEGLAQGLEMPIEDVFAWNCRGDLWAGAADGCTTIQRPWPDRLIAHNEDGDPLFAGRCALAHIKPEAELGFTAFVYPGSIPGHTFGVNAAGLCLTVNNLRTLAVEAGMPRMVLTRALLAQPSLASALDCIRSTQVSGGFHVTLGQAGEDHLYSIEFTCRQHSILDLNVMTGHANHMIHPQMQDEPQIVTDSSRTRQARLQTLLQDNPAIEPLDIVFDVKNKSLPIYRQDPNDPDGENTMASARFEIATAQIIWQVHQGRASEPVYRLINERLSA